MICSHHAKDRVILIVLAVPVLDLREGLVLRVVLQQVPRVRLVRPVDVQVVVEILDSRLFLTPVSGKCREVYLFPVF